MVAVALRHRLKAAQPTNRMFDDHPPPGKRRMLGRIRRWSRSAARRAPWGRAQALWMQFAHPDVRQVA